MDGFGWEEDDGWAMVMITDTRSMSEDERG